MSAGSGAPVEGDSERYSADSERYRNEEKGLVRGADPDPDLYLDPEETAKLVGPDIPIAHNGKAGFAVERATGRAVHLPGKMQWDVIKGERRRRASLPAPRLVDRPADAPKLPSPRPDVRSAQVNTRFTPAEHAAVLDAARIYGVAAATLCRMLVNLGVSAILADDSQPHHASPEGPHQRNWGA